MWDIKNGIAVAGAQVGYAPGYSIIGTGDFNGDGTSDILLQSGSSIVDWMVQNNVAVAGNLLGSGLVGWSVVGTGDYNGDGASDIALQNGTTVVDWSMLNGVVSSGNTMGNSGTYFVKG